MKFIIALSPLLVVLVGILGFKKSAMKVAPLALLWTLVLAFTYFNIKGLAFNANVDIIDALLWKGIKEGMKIVLMVFGAFVILNTLRRTGAMEDVKNTIAKISDDRRVQLIIIGMMLPIFLEGAAGAGAPAAIAAPFLVALGFDPITAITAALLGDATPCSWGGAGLTTIFGGSALVEAGLSTVALNSAMVGRIHMFGVLIIPFIMVAMAFGRKGFRNILPYLTYAGITTCITMFVLSNYVGAEVTSMGTGLISMLFSVLYVKIFKLKTPDEFRHHFPSGMRQKYSSLRAVSPYLYMLVLLPAVRYGVPAFVENGFALMCTFGYIVWVDVVILLCGFLGARTLGVNLEEYWKTCGETLKGVMPVLVTMGSLLVVAYIMQSSSTGMMNLLASDIASAAGRLYPAAAVLIGSSGSFVTGTGLGSNIMFANLHIDAAASLGMNPITVFAGQNAGGSLGNLVCPNNVVAACATVGQTNNEYKVMKKSLPVFLVILLLYMTLATLYTLVLFPNFGQAS
ncbi:MAG: L-lactate permease [Fretibacterium sp.]|nr:L-lactate permease [Fretibacterium sp.]